MLSRVCEEFGCLPSEARRELDCDPEQLALLIIDARAYMRCKTAYDSAKDDMDDKLDPWRDSPLLDAVIANTQARVVGARPKKSPIVLTDTT